MLCTDNPHFNIGNIQIELTTDNSNEGGEGNGGHTRSMCY